MRRRILSFVFCASAHLGAQGVQQASTNGLYFGVGLSAAATFPIDLAASCGSGCAGPYGRSLVGSGGNVGIGWGWRWVSVIGNIDLLGARTKFPADTVNGRPERSYKGSLGYFDLSLRANVPTISPRFVPYALLTIGSASKDITFSDVTTVGPGGLGGGGAKYEGNYVGYGVGLQIGRRPAFNGWGMWAWDARVTNSRLKLQDGPFDPTWSPRFSVGMAFWVKLQPPYSAPQ